MDEPTAWEDINPTTALAPRLEQPTAFSQTPLAPASATELRDELTACLALVVPVGMTEEGRGEWLAVARKTLDHLPADLLAIGCKKARETCDHPSKIVPTILDYVSDMLEWRRESARDAARRAERLLTAKPCTPAAAETILKDEGILDAVRGNVKNPLDRGPLRKPTRKDYIEMGVDPAVLDSISGPPQ